MGAILRIILPYDLTTGMKRWRFKGAKLQTVPIQDYFVAGTGVAAAAAGAALPAVVGAEGVAAAACGWAFGLIQQAWTRSSKLFCTLSSIWAPNRVRQRKAA